MHLVKERPQAHPLDAASEAITAAIASIERGAAALAAACSEFTAHGDSPGTPVLFLNAHVQRALHDFNEAIK